MADSITRSAPCSSGRQTIGEANVLSTVSSAPWRWAASARAGMSATTQVGLAMVSTWRIRVGARGQRGLDRLGVGRVHVGDLDAQPPERGERLASGWCRSPRADQDSRSPVRGARGSPRGSRPCRSRARSRPRLPWSSATASPRAVDGRVVDAAVGVPGPVAGEDGGQLLGVRGGERRGLVDGHGGGHLAHGGTREAARIARVEGPGRGRSVGHRPMLHRRSDGTRYRVPHW